MTLTARQRTKINAALSLIYDTGHDATGVIELANSLMGQGQDPRSAYENAINGFIAREPALTPVISKVLNLVDASDDKTVDQYDAALSGYLTTGDDSSLKALAPMIAQDSLALAVKEGEITQDEAANGDLAKALGFEPGEALVEAAAATAQQPSQQQAHPQQFHWSSPDAAPKIDAVPTSSDTYSNGSQVSFGGGPAGMIAPKAAQIWAAEAAAREAVRGDCVQSL